MTSKLSEAFNAALKAFERSAKTHKNHARKVAIMALEHFAEHGDLAYADRFLEVLIDTRTLRARSFVSWMAKYSPCELVKGKFKATKQGNWKTDCNLEGAKEEDFWNVDVESPVQNYGITELFAALDSVIKRMEGEKIHLMPKATVKLNKIKTDLAYIRDEPVTDEELIEAGFTPEETASEESQAA